jgi:hypothetical protein
MTTASFFASSPWPRSLWIGSLIVASVLLSPAFHCGFPLAAFAAVAALTLGRRDVLLLSGAVWLASQTIAFASLHHHMTDAALAWSVGRASSPCFLVMPLDWPRGARRGLRAWPRPSWPPSSSIRA